MSAAVLHREPGLDAGITWQFEIFSRLQDLHQAVILTQDVRGVDQLLYDPREKFAEALKNKTATIMLY